MKAVSCRDWAIIPYCRNANSRALKFSLIADLSVEPGTPAVGDAENVRERGRGALECHAQRQRPGGRNRENALGVRQRVGAKTQLLFLGPVGEQRELARIALVAP